MIRLLPALVLGIASCGYEVGGLHLPADVRVEIFDNLSERRMHEFDLSRAIAREMVARGFRVNSKDAPYVLRGKILDIRNPSVVEGKSDVVLVGSLRFRVEIELVRAGDEGRLWKDETAVSVSFTAARGETLESARQRVFDELARWVVRHFEKEW